MATLVTTDLISIAKNKIWNREKLVIYLQNTVRIKGLPMQCVDVIVTSECIHLYILCIVPQCLFQEVFVM